MTKFNYDQLSVTWAFGIQEPFIINAEISAA